MKKVYSVHTNDNFLLGYATGDVEDIDKYFDDAKAYTIYVEEIQIVHVTPEKVGERIELLKKKLELEEELVRTNSQIGYTNIHTHRGKIE